MAVYTEVADADLAQFIAAHGVGELRSFKGIAEGVENTNYMVETSTGRYILTLYEKRVDARDLPFFLGLMEHLSAAGISCPLPVRDRGGRMICELAGRPAAIVTFLDGLSYKQPDATHCGQVGMELARLHAAARGFPLSRANALGPSGWQPLYERFASRADEVRPGLADLIESELAYLLPRWPTALPAGVIHADLFPDNVFFLAGKVSGIIDFYFACNDFLAYDLAVCLNAWCFEKTGDLDPARSAALFKGYQDVRQLEQAEIAALPLLARGAALRFLLTRAHDWLATPEDALVAPHDPIDYIRRLAVHRGIETATAYGLEG